MNKIVDLEQACENFKNQISDQTTKYSEEIMSLREEIDTLKNKCNTLKNTISQKNIEISSLQATIQNARLSTKIKNFFQR